VLKVDAIKKQMPSWNQIRFALDGCTSTNQLAILSVITDYMDQHWALLGVQLDFDACASPIFERYLRMKGQGPIYCSEASDTFEGHA